MLNALFDNPEEIYQKNCPTSGTNCSDFMDEQFPIDSDLIDPMYKLTLQMLMVGMKNPTDLENNAKDAQTVQAIQ